MFSSPINIVITIIGIQLCAFGSFHTFSKESRDVESVLVWKEFVVFYSFNLLTALMFLYVAHELKYTTEFSILDTIAVAVVVRSLMSLSEQALTLKRALYFRDELLPVVIIISILDLIIILSGMRIASIHM